MVKKFLLLLLPIVIIGLSAFLYVANKKSDGQKNGSNNSGQNKTTDSGIDKTKYSTTDPTSIWVIVNKKNSLPENFEPNDLVSIGEDIELRSEPAQNLQNLKNEAKAEGFNLSSLSAYRSFQKQKEVYEDYVKKDGQDNADTYSARPGHSEHQSGLAVDLGSGTCDLKECFGATDAGIWLANNAHKYGFIIRYPKEMQNITGYHYEPWHLRYVGAELAQEIKNTNQTLEQLFDLPAAANY